MFHDFHCLWCIFTKGNWQIYDRGIHLKNPKPNQTHQEIPEISGVPSSNPPIPLNPIPPEDRIEIAKVNDKELAEKCPGINVILGPGIKTRVDAWVFFSEAWGEAPRFFT